MAERVTSRELAETEEIVSDFLKYRLEKRGLQWTNNNTRNYINSDSCRAMQRLSDEFLEMYPTDVAEMVDNGAGAIGNDLVAAHRCILNEHFDEGISWSGIVAAFVLTAEMAYQYSQKDSPAVIGRIKSALVDYIVTALYPWIRDQGGWDDLVRFDRSRDKDDTSIWSGSLFKGAVCGVALGALALGALMSSRT